MVGRWLRLKPKFSLTSKRSITKVGTPRHRRPKRGRHHKAQRRKVEGVRAIERIGDFGTFLARGRRPRLTD